MPNSANIGLLLRNGINFPQGIMHANAWFTSFTFVLINESRSNGMKGNVISYCKSSFYVANLGNKVYVCTCEDLILVSESWMNPLTGYTLNVPVKSMILWNASHFTVCRMHRYILNSSCILLTHQHRI